MVRRKTLGTVGAPHDEEHGLAANDKRVGTGVGIAAEGGLVAALGAVEDVDQSLLRRDTDFRAKALWPACTFWSLVSRLDSCV